MQDSLFFASGHSCVTWIYDSISCDPSFSFSAWSLDYEDQWPQDGFATSGQGSLSRGHLHSKWANAEQNTTAVQTDYSFSFDFVKIKTIVLWFSASF